MEKTTLLMLLPITLLEYHLPSKSQDRNGLKQNGPYESLRLFFCSHWFFLFSRAQSVPASIVPTDNGVPGLPSNGGMTSVYTLCTCRQWQIIYMQDPQRLRESGLSPTVARTGSRLIWATTKSLGLMEAPV